MLEDIRQSLMVRMHDIVKKLEVCKDEICPNIRKRLNKIDSLTRFCEILPGVGGKYEVKHLNVTYIVDLGAGLCSCVDWNLTAIPCVHAMACINHSRVHVENFVDPFYFKTTCQAAYKFCLEPSLGESEWPKINECPIQPPYVCKLPGRPKKNRKRAEDELRMHSSNKITKHGVKMKCSMCGGVGHNKRSCLIAKSAAIGSEVLEQPCNASTSELRKHKRQAREGFGVLVAESGNILWRNPSGGRAQLVVTSRHPNDCVQVGDLTRGQQTRVEQASQANGSQVLDNPTPHL
ncbi:uncharacterized protein LOC131022238 [Salvia miltiorrhiza]|uniref:uncharacterized protein LOC131022238 n=1 Tax=Salvia miltiorrhiza TaxID=226208 RepID=UPI0025AD7881|nr:uncharacterized protein LOC131022238 [Salvia miltiorrhiza]